MKIKVFENDKDFESYVFKPNYVIKQSEISDRYYYDTEFTSLYEEDLENDVKFHIKSKDSAVRRRGCVTKGVISKKVDNILDYYEMDLYLRMCPEDVEIIDFSRAPENEE